MIVGKIIAVLGLLLCVGLAMFSHPDDTDTGQ